MRLPRWGRAASITCTLLLLAGCASLNRGCSSFNANNFGADWVVTQFDMNGKVFNCWKLKNVSLANEESSDGIHWAGSHGGHLIHVSGWYNRVQVSDGDYAAAARQIGVDITQCDNGHYPAAIVDTSRKFGGS